MEQVLFGGYYVLLGNAETRYEALSGGSSFYATEAARYSIVSTDGKIKNLRVKLSVAPGVDKHWDFTLMVNSAPTALTLEIADAATTGNNMVNEIVVTGGDTVSIRCEPTNAPTASYPTWNTVFIGDTANESIILGGTANTVSNADIEYGQIMGMSTIWSASENDHRQVIPTAGTIKKLYVKLSADPGTAPDAYRFTLRKNGASQTLTVTITADATTGNDVVNSFAVAAGDTVTLMCEPLNIPSVTPFAKWGMTFLADTDGESIVLGGCFDDLNNAATEYNYLTSNEHSGQAPWVANENQRYQLGQVCTIKKLYILLSAAPGAGNTYTFTIRLAGANSNVVAAVANAATTGNSGGLSDTVANDEYVDLQVVPDDTPDVADAYWGFVCYISSIEQYTKTFTADAHLLKRGTKTFVSDALLLQPNTKGFLADAHLLQRNIKAFDADAILRYIKTKTFTADALLLQPNSKGFLTDAHLLKRYTKTFTVDALLTQRYSKGFLVDGWLLQRRTKTFKVDAILTSAIPAPPPTIGTFGQPVPRPDFPIYLMTLIRDYVEVM